MNQRVPSWDLLDDYAVAAAAGAHRVAASAGAFTSTVSVPVSDQYYEQVAELTWEKGNISSHGLLNRPVAKYPLPPPPSSAQLHPIGETLEAVVGEAAARSSSTSLLAQPPLAQAVPAAAAAPWLGVVGAVALQRAAVDALVPCARVDESEAGEDARSIGRNKRARVVIGEDGRACASQGSAAPGRRGESTLLTLELDHACGTGADDLCGFTTTTNNSTSLDREDDVDKGSPETENTSIGGGAGASDSTRFFSHHFQRGSLCDEEEHDVVIKGGAAMRASISTKRSRAAAIHNESERKRRDRINQKMKTLQKLVPNSSKTDKASMLDEVIDYLKQMQAQVQVMSRMSSMMMPMAMPQLQMSVMANMAQMAQMAQMGLGMMNMGSLAQPGYAGLTPPMMHPPPPAPFVPMSWDANATASAVERPQPPPAAAGGAAPDAFSAFLACQAAQQNAQQQQPSSMEAYTRMMAMYQRLNQQQSSSKQ